MPDRLPAGFRITGRDRAIIREIARSNLATADQLVRAGHFTSISRSRRRLAAMEGAGLLRRSYFATGSPSAISVFAIGPAAVPLLASDSAVGPEELRRQALRPIGRTFIEHSLAVFEVRLSLAGPEGRGALSFASEAEVRHEYSVGGAGNSRKHVFKPDGLFLSEGAAMFLELDRSYASHESVALCFESYGRYLRLGLFGAEYGPRTPRVLFVTDAGQRRIARLAGIAARFPDLNFHFATLDAVVAGGPAARAWTRGPGAEAVSLFMLAETREEKGG